MWLQQRHFQTVHKAGRRSHGKNGTSGPFIEITSHCRVLYRASVLIKDAPAASKNHLRMPTQRCFCRTGFRRFNTMGCGDFDE
jgi:hypothetical protein